jgi:eukaryotic-like serine/threonine-protein kinase
VREVASGREAALKWLPAADASRRHEAAGLDGPLERARRIEHPGLAAVDEVGEAGEGVYVVREWVEGVPLPRVGELPLPAALGLARQLAAALAAAHREGLVHGRVKPENLVLEIDGRLRLADLGAGLVAGPAASVAAAERLLAPEQRSGATGDARSDVFAAAVLLHRLALGSWPGEAPAAADALPPALSALLARAASDDPAARPADGAALLRELEAIAG